MATYGATVHLRIPRLCAHPCNLHLHLMSSFFMCKEHPHLARVWLIKVGLKCSRFQKDKKQTKTSKHRDVNQHGHFTNNIYHFF